MPDNIFPDLTNDEFDIKYNQLKILASDVRSLLFNQGRVISSPQTGDTGGGEGGGDGGDSGGDSGSDDFCQRWVNVGREASTGVSYIDCDGNEVLGVSIEPYGQFCALSIINMGTCGALVPTGECVECGPCCAPTVNSVSVN